jgi:hypothetical protein
MGHMGFDKCWIMISAEYWRHDLYSLVTKFIESCELCAMNRTHRLVNSQPIPVVATRPMDILMMDHMIMKVTSNGYNYILSVEDVFSRRVWWLGSRTMDASETMQLLLDWVIYPNDFPNHFISDNGGSFDNELSQLLCRAANINHEFNLPNRKTKGATGQIENKNRIAWTLLRKMVDAFTQDDWSDYLSVAACIYNKTPSSALDNYSPYEVFSGFSPKGLVDFSTISRFNVSTTDYVVEFVRKTEIIWKTVQKAIAKSAVKRNLVPFEWKVGDYTLIRRSDDMKNIELNSKLATRNAGPFKVVSVKPERNRLRIEIAPNNFKDIHVDEAIVWKGPIPVNDDTKFTPLLNEIIPDLTIPTIATEGWNECSETEKARFDIKSIVGKTISLYWPTHKEWYTGRVIGYNSKLTHNLVFYNRRLPDVPRCVDYYASYLFPTTEKGRRDLWKLLR